MSRYDQFDDKRQADATLSPIVGRLLAAGLAPSRPLSRFWIRESPPSWEVAHGHDYWGHPTFVTHLAARITPEGRLEGYSWTKNSKGWRQQTAVLIWLGLVDLASFVRTGPPPQLAGFIYPDQPAEKESP